MAQWNPYYSNDPNNIPSYNATTESDNIEQNYYMYGSDLDYNFSSQYNNVNNYYYLDGMNPNMVYNPNMYMPPEQSDSQFQSNIVKNSQSGLFVNNQLDKTNMQTMNSLQPYNQEFNLNTSKSECSGFNISAPSTSDTPNNHYFDNIKSPQDVTMRTKPVINSHSFCSETKPKYSNEHFYKHKDFDVNDTKRTYDRQKFKNYDYKNKSSGRYGDSALDYNTTSKNSKHSFEKDTKFNSKQYTNSRKEYFRDDYSGQLKNDHKNKVLKDAAEFLNNQSDKNLTNPPKYNSNVPFSDTKKKVNNSANKKTYDQYYDQKSSKYNNQKTGYSFRENREHFYNNSMDYRSPEQHTYDYSKKKSKNNMNNYSKKNSNNLNRNRSYESEKGTFNKVKRNNFQEQNYDGFKTNVYSNKMKTKNKSYGESSNQKTSQINDDNEIEKLSQREWLTEQVLNGSLECLVCCERVRQNDSTWSCNNCYHIIHLQCVRKWATSSQAEKGWRCPACQHVYHEVPIDYLCYCGVTKDPSSNTLNTPHSCGEMCGRVSRRSNCNHKCTLVCHPGPCPPCEAVVVRFCGCGSSKKSVLCNHSTPVLCENICNKILNCGLHKCEQKCHIANCDPCSKKIEQKCHCTKNEREINCTSENIGVLAFICNEICEQLLLCGNHKCNKICHEDSCGDCELSPSIIKACFCGQTELSLEKERKSCLDPIPTCDKICSKILKCGPSNCPHICKIKCHSGPCPPCNGNTLARCRCGHMDREVPCKQLTGRPDDARCEKKCTKKRMCGRHKCNKLCCIEIEHECPLPCNRMLSCGKHRCEQTCHRGRCLPCYRSSFEELFCECGTSVLYPPIPCGTRRPACSQLCSRQHDCDHPVLHNCHNESECPPCSVLTHKWCYGKHELRKTIPCHQKEFTCGRPCGKDVACGKHKCIAMCHSGVCLLDNVKCTQPCKTPRPTCGHPCAAPCHEDGCPDTPCKETVKVTCECGHRSTSRGCADNAKEYQRIATAMLASKMADMQLGHSVDIGDIMGNNLQKKQNSLKTLPCNDECRIIERNRRLAIGLQIRNPDLSAKLTPRYSEFMRQWGKKDPRFCQIIHDKLTELVQLAKQSKQKNRSYSFDSMNHEKRHFIHEYCEHFGCESAAYDKEPNRNVVATAARDKAWLPSYSLLEVLQREAGQRKLPGPVLTASKPTFPAESVILRSINRDRPSSLSNSTVQSNSTGKFADGEYVDYFDAPLD